MSVKRILALLMAMMMSLAVLPASADEAKGSRTIEYTGGVVLRSIPRGAEDSELIQLAYTMSDAPYIVMNRPYEWDLFISGGTAPYTMSAVIWRQDMNATGNTYYYYTEMDLSEPKAVYTFTEDGRYFWEFDVSDSEGQSLSFQSKIYEVYKAEDETDDTTTIGKANSIVSQLITDDMSDYGRAKVLHDWLIYNANYDYTFTYYDASGVLVHGTGVCDSYARAYLILCTAAGLECVYVTGTAGQAEDPEQWGNHAWNMVKLNGSWYHVDCTWDDPESGGYERHTYFCVDDETLAKDHRWNKPDDLFNSGGMLVPEAEGGEYEATEAALGDHDFTFSTWDEFGAELDKMVAAGDCRATTIGLYTGTLTVPEMYNTMADWANVKANQLASKGKVTGYGYGCYGNLFLYNLVWKDPSAYIRIDEESLRLSIGETVTLYPSEFDPCDDVFTWTSSNEAVAKVAYVWNADAETPIAVQITAIDSGSATITATSPDGITDSVSVTVLKPHAPEFDLVLTSASNQVELTWNAIPGVTSYKVVRVFNNSETTLATVTGAGTSISAAKLPANVQQQVYVIAERVIAGETHASYTSEAVTYGQFDLTYAAVLPSGTTSIGDAAFLNNTSLTTVSVPAGVTVIGSRAFAGCTGLTAVSVPESVGSIGSDAFSGCPLVYAEVTEGSYADNWFQKYYPDVMLIY